MREEAIHLFKQAHAIVHDTDLLSRAEAPVSDRTKADYRRTAKRLLKLDAGRDQPVLLSETTRQSWFHNRAALLHIVSSEYVEASRLCSEYLSNMDWRAALGRARVMHRAALLYREILSSQAPTDRTRSRQTKRRTVPKSNNWRSICWHAATDAQKPAVACAWVGARPAEIEMGISIRRSEKGVWVKISGAKVSDRTGAGQPVRILHVDRETEAGRALLHAIPDGEDEVDVKRRAKRISLDWVSIREKTGFKNVSAYTLRHAAAADLKSDPDIGPEQVSAALGHASIRSQKRYGSRRQGTGKSAILKASAARQVRRSVDRFPSLLVQDT